MKAFLYKLILSFYYSINIIYFMFMAIDNQPISRFRDSVSKEGLKHFICNRVMVETFKLLVFAKPKQHESPIITQALHLFNILFRH